MKRNFVFLIFLSLLVRCASSFLAPENIRQADFVEKTGVKKGTAYNRALGWLDKKVHFKPGAAREEDPGEGHMKMAANYDCNVFRKENDLKEYFLAFDLDVVTSQQGIALHFTDLKMENKDGQVIQKPESQLSTAERIDKVQPCLKKLVTELLKAVESNKVTW